MAIVDRVKSKAEDLKPRRTDCILYARPLPLVPEEYPDVGEDYEYKAVRGHTDRHLIDLEGEERASMLAPFYAKGGLTMLGIHKPTDKAVTKMNLVTYSPPSSEARIGVLNIRLAWDEAFLFDIWTHPDFRRSGIAFTLAYQMGRVVDHLYSHLRWVYGYAHKDNEASQNLMELVYGMWPVQEFAEIEIGKYFVTSVPGADNPKFGPFSKVGRHSGAGVRVPGRPRSGEKYRDYHSKKGFAIPPLDAEVSLYVDVGPDWFDNDHALDPDGNLATPETLKREFGDI